MGARAGEMGAAHWGRVSLRLQRWEIPSTAGPQRDKVTETASSHAHVHTHKGKVGAMLWVQPEAAPEPWPPPPRQHNQWGPGPHWHLSALPAQHLFGRQQQLCCLLVLTVFHEEV